MSQLTIVKFFGLLVEPLSQVLLLLLFALYLYSKQHRKIALSALVLASVWLWLASSAFVSGYLMAWLEEAYPPIAAQTLPQADAIILLGGAIRGEVSEDTLADMSGVGDRLVFAVAVYKAGKAPIIVVTGGAGDGFTPEASLIRNILVTMGVPPSAIVLEVRNRITLDNGRYTRDTLLAMGAKSVLLVTSAFHMRRALLVFGALDVEVTPAPTDFQVLQGEPSFWHYVPNVKSLQRTTWALHEIAGYLYYLALKSTSS